MLEQKIPTFGIKNIKIYYFLAIFLNGWFILPNWFFYYIQHLSIVEIGIVEGVAILTSILLEVPSGALADTIGKVKTIILGSLAIIVSCVVLTQVNSFSGFIIGEVIMFIGFALHSGAVEAFGYDSLVEKGSQDKYDRVVSRHTSLAIIATISATFLGGFLYSIDPKTPFYAWAVFLLLSIVALSFASEPKTSTHHVSFASYTSHLKKGVSDLFNTSLRKYLVPILTIVALIKLYQGMVRQSIAGYFQLTGETFGYVFALVTIPAVFLSFRFDRIKAFLGQKKMLTLHLLAYLIAFVTAALATSPIIGVLVFLTLVITENLSQPLISSIINQSIQSEHRATTLSALSLFSQIPYIILVFFFASMVEMENLPNLMWIYASLIGVALTYCIVVFGKNAINKLEKI